MPNQELITDSVLQFSRVDKLYAWMRRERRSFISIARSISCTELTARRLLLRDTAPSHRVHQLRESGIPEELLPAPLDIPPGPKPKNPLPDARS